MKPDRSAAMKMLIAQVLQAFPLDNPELAVCGSGKTCEGCPKKLLEIVDSEIRYWQSELDHGETPTFGDIEKFAQRKLGKKKYDGNHKSITRQAKKFNDP